ncbi:MAG: hypothetical protein ACI4N3_02990 [Alphaproteobacteria bacterium]
MEFKFLQNPSVIKLFDLFESENKKIYVVGGAVRNSLLGEQTNDIDFATSTKPEDVLQILQNNNIETDLKGMKFGTISAIINDEKFDITTFRKDYYARGSRFPEIICSKKIRDDFVRRDFTVNAIYVDRIGRTIDLGGGLEDLEKGILKFIINPRKSIYFDPLRILRYFRFCSLYFYNNFDEASLTACILKFARVKKTLPKKKIKYELSKMLDGKGFEIILDIWRKNDIIYDINEYIDEVKIEMGKHNE